MWLFAPLVKVLFTKLSSDTRALVSSTFAYTIISGGNQTNIIPNHVEANINVRLAPFDTVDDVLNHIKKVIKDDDIKLTTAITLECQDISIEQSTHKFYSFHHFFPLNI